MSAALLAPLWRKPYILGGNAKITLVSTKSGCRFTFRIRAKEVEPGRTLHFVSVLTGPENTTDYSFLGTIFDGDKFVHGKKSKITADAPSAKAFSWLWRNLASEDSGTADAAAGAAASSPPRSRLSAALGRSARREHNAHPSQQLPQHHLSCKRQTRRSTELPPASPGEVPLMWYRRLHLLQRDRHPWSAPTRPAPVVSSGRPMDQSLNSFPSSRTAITPRSSRLSKLLDPKRSHNHDLLQVDRRAPAHPRCPRRAVGGLRYRSTTTTRHQGAQALPVSTPCIYAGATAQTTA